MDFLNGYGHSFFRLGFVNLELMLWDFVHFLFKTISQISFVLVGSCLSSDVIVMKIFNFSRRSVFDKKLSIGFPEFFPSRENDVDAQTSCLQNR